jgi:hypothetical protein
MRIVYEKLGWVVSSHDCFLWIVAVCLSAFGSLADGQEPGLLPFVVRHPTDYGCAGQEYVHTLDGNTGASLKLSILNPKGRIWTMVAGGGASVIYADTVGDLGLANELGNYAEYSGAPNQQASYIHSVGL